MDLGKVKRAKKQSRGAGFVRRILSSVLYISSTFTHTRTHSRIKDPSGELLPLTTGRARGRR